MYPIENVFSAMLLSFVIDLDIQIVDSDAIVNFICNKMHGFGDFYYIPGIFNKFYYSVRGNYSNGKNHYSILRNESMTQNEA